MRDQKKEAQEHLVGDERPQRSLQPSPAETPELSHAKPLERWQAIRYGDRVETVLALAFYREHGWPVDDQHTACMDTRIYAFQAGYRAAKAEGR